MPTRFYPSKTTGEQLFLRKLSEELDKKILFTDSEICYATKGRKKLQTYAPKKRALVALSTMTSSCSNSS